MIKRSEALAVLAKHRTDEVVVTTMSTNHEWSPFSKQPDLDLQIRGVMGQAPSVGMGLALAQPGRKVWVLNGDGSQLMYLGALGSIAQAAPKNLVLFIFQNDQYERTGGQPIPLAKRLDFAGVARSLCIERAHTFDEIGALEAQIGEILEAEGPTCVVLKVVRGERGASPWPSMSDQVARLMQALGSPA